MVPASELHADTLAEETSASGPLNHSFIIDAGDGVEFQLVGENGEVVIRSNRETIDDSASQTLTMEEIEELKREGTSAGKDLIAKLMLSHTGIEQKTAFSLAKYKLLKTKKYLRRFVLLPLDVAILCQWMVEDKDAGKTLEVREEMLALAGSWSNVHYAHEPPSMPGSGGGRWLVVDETGGLLVASMAERMGILYPDDKLSEDVSETRARECEHSFVTSNTLTLLHTNAQPNLSLLNYFHYSPNAPSSTSYHTHPLATHLLPLSWLQLISPELDSTYSSQPPIFTPQERLEMKSGKRGTYYRKLRRYNRTKHIVDSTLGGNFDGLAIASSMSPESILRHTISLLRGGAPIVIYSPTIEPLVQLTDCYSTSRRTAFIQSPPAAVQALDGEVEKARWKGNEDFPLNPTLLLNANVQSARVREWQVLPGRTHPKMTGKGGAEGYLFTGVRVRPAKGKVEARGKFLRRKEKVVSKAEDVVRASEHQVSGLKTNGGGQDESSTQIGVEDSQVHFSEDDEMSWS